MEDIIADEDQLLFRNEVARIFRVNPKTVTGWARRGVLNSVVTPGGHRRYWASEVRALLKQQGVTA